MQEKQAPQDSPREEAQAPATASVWLARLNEFGERNAKIIITLSTALIILTVLVFAKYFYDEHLVQTAETELGRATSVEKLKELKQLYGATPVGPKISYRLANRYYEENKLAEARAEYADFKAKYPTHRLAAQVQISLDSVDRNMNFVQLEKEGRLKARLLQTHPRHLSDLKDPRLQWGPASAEKPLVEIDMGSGPLRIELYPDEAPRAVEDFLKRCESKGFDGVKWEIVKEGERVGTLAKEGAAAETLPFEAPAREAEAYALVLVRKEGAAENVAGRFQVLLKAAPELKDVTIFGSVYEGSAIVSSIRKDEAIRSSKVTRRGPVAVEKPGK